MFEPNEYNYQGRLKRAVNLLIFSLAGVSLSFASIYLLTQFHFGRSSTEIEIKIVPFEIEEAIESPFHIPKPEENIFNGFSTDTLIESHDLSIQSSKEEAETNPEFEFSWPELLPDQR